MNTATIHDPVVVGIDVSKARLDCAVRPSRDTFHVPNTPAGHAALAARLAPLAPALIVLEATGGYEAGVLRALTHARLPVTRVNARHARHFAQAVGQLAKTDRVDAHVLAHFAQAVRPPVRALAPDSAQALRALTTRRAQLVDMLAMERTRAAGVDLSAAARARIDAHVTWLKDAVAQLDGELKQAVAQDETTRERARCLRSVPGVGPVLTSILLARLPELGAVGRKRAAALVGVAPFAHDSGERTGVRRCWGGRADVRTVLYMATLSAKRHNPTIRALYERLIAKGKPKKLALTACSHKLLTICGAVIRDNTVWDPKLAARA